VNGLALFAGYGGLELGAGAAFGGGVRTVCYVERESYAASTLVARMEESSLDQAPIWDDVTTFDGEPWRGVVDLVTAGFPCQPFSAAGKQRGMDDERWLWDDIERILREVQPRWFVGENVPGLVRLGLEAVLRSLASLGYDVVWGAFQAGQMGASHKRERIFILAHLAKDADGIGRRGRSDGDSRGSQRQTETSGLRRSMAKLADLNEDGRCEQWGRREQQTHQGDLGLLGEELADARRQLSQSEDVGGQPAVEESGAQKPIFAPGPQDLDLWARVLVQSPSLEPSVCRMADGVADRLEYRSDRLRLLGNGVVPLQAAVALRVLADRAGWKLN